jgi:hypothetical protein
MGSGDPPGLQNRREAGHPVFGAFDSHTLPPCIFISLEASIPPDIDPLKAQITLIVMKL